MEVYKSNLSLRKAQDILLGYCTQEKCHGRGSPVGGLVTRQIGEVGSLGGVSLSRRIWKGSGIFAK